MESCVAAARPGLQSVRVAPPTHIRVRSDLYERALGLATAAGPCRRRCPTAAARSVCATSACCRLDGSPHAVTVTRTYVRQHSSREMMEQASAGRLCCARLRSCRRARRRPPCSRGSSRPLQQLRKQHPQQQPHHCRRSHRCATRQRGRTAGWSWRICSCCHCRQGRWPSLGASWSSTLRCCS